MLEYQNFIAALLIIFKISTKLFWWSTKIIFFVSSKTVHSVYTWFITQQM